MSTYWGLHCISCPEATESNPWSGCVYHSAHKADLSKYARAAQVIKQFRENAALPDDLKLVAEFADGGDDFLGWLAQHAGHPMMLYNEYGHLEPLQESPK